MKRLVWNGITEPERSGADYIQVLENSFTNIQLAKWQTLITELAALPEYSIPDLINAFEPNNSALHTLLHHSAHKNASVETIEQLINLGASRYQQNAQGQNALDIAQAKGHETLYTILQPVPKVSVSLADMQKIEAHIHNTILSDEIAAGCIEEYVLCLPQVDMLLECDKLNGYFPIPEYLGGFSIWLDRDETEPTVYVFSTSRMDNDGDSARFYRVTPHQSELLAKGREVEERYFKKMLHTINGKG